MRIQFPITISSNPTMTIERRGGYGFTFRIDKPAGWPFADKVSTADVRDGAAAGNLFEVPWALLPGDKDLPAASTPTVATVYNLVMGPIPRAVFIRTIHVPGFVYNTSDPVLVNGEPAGRLVQPGTGEVPEMGLHIRRPGPPVSWSSPEPGEAFTVSIPAHASAAGKFVIGYPLFEVPAVAGAVGWPIITGGGRESLEEAIRIYERRLKQLPSNAYNPPVAGGKLRADALVVLRKAGVDW